jgi:hypothetical protein
MALPRDEEVEKHFRTIRDHEGDVKLALKAYMAGQGGYTKLTKPPGNKNWPTVTTSQLKNRIADSQSQGKLVDGRCILTLDEEEGMVTWMRAMGKGGRPPKKLAKDAKLKQILELRKRVNLSGGRKAIALSLPANEFMLSGVTHAKFWSAFANKYGTLLRTAIVRKDDARRMEAAHEGTVDVHFNGEYGVIETARKHGIMDDRGVLDKTRILNTDESPQFVAFDTVHPQPRSSR